jgi:hypothetical protein
VSCDRLALAEDELEELGQWPVARSRTLPRVLSLAMVSNYCIEASAETPAARHVEPTHTQTYGPLNRNPTNQHGCMQSALHIQIYRPQLALEVQHRHAYELLHVT